MTTRAEYEEMLLNAHRAGDTVSAGKIVQAMDALPEEDLSPYGRLMQDKKESLENSKSMVGMLMSPGGRDIVGDSVLGGFGGEIWSGLKALGKSATDKQGPEKTFRKYYDESMASHNQRKDEFHKKHPGVGAVGSIAPAVMSGNLMMKVANPTTWPRAAALTGLEGAMFGAGEADPGLKNRAVGGGIGGGVGAVGGVTGSLVEGALKNVPKVSRGVNNLFSRGEKTIDPDTVDKEAWKHVANVAKRAGDTEGTLTAKLGGSSDTTTVADKIAGGEPLIRAASGFSDDTSRMARDSVPTSRMKTTTERLRGGLGADSEALKTTGIYAKKLENVREKAGAAIEDRITEVHGIPLSNQDDIDAFLQLKKNRGLKERVIANLEIDDLDPLYVDSEVDGALSEFIEEGIGDANAFIKDEPFMQELLSELNSDISVLKQEGKSWAAANKLKKQAEKLVEEGQVDDTLKSLRSKYGVAIRDQKAYTLGAEKFSTMSESTIMDTLEDITPSQLAAFREGAVNSIGNKKTDLLSFLDNEGELRNIALVFGPGKKKKFSTVGEQFTKEREVSASVAEGISGQTGRIIGDTFQGKLEAVVDVMGRLRGKRAYSAKGGYFMVANEILDVMMTSHQPEAVVKKMFKILATSGDDVNEALIRIRDVEMPLLIKNQVIEAGTRAANKARMGGYGSGAAQGAGLINNIMQDED